MRESYYVKNVLNPVRSTGNDDRKMANISLLNHHVGSNTKTLANFSYF